MGTPNRVSIYRWANAPKNLQRPFGRNHRDWVAYVPKGCELRPTHFARRLEDVVKKARRDGSTLIAGDEPKPERGS